MGEKGLDLAALQQSLGVTFRDVALLLRALTHASYVNEHAECTWGDNERLEFLGDAVVDFVAAECLYERFPQWSEGQLTFLRAELVRSETLASFAAVVGLGGFLLLGRGEDLGGGRSRATLLSDAFEALLGAVYLDQGLDAARRFLLPLLQSQLDKLSSPAGAQDAKTRLQEWAQAAYHETPGYVTVEETGPDHAKRFTVAVIIRGQVSGRGDGPNKQAAEQAAAAAALLALAPEGSMSGSLTPE